MLRRNFKNFTRVWVFIVLLIFFFITIQMASQSRNSVTVGSQSSRESESFIISGRELSGLQNKVQGRLVTMINRNAKTLLHSGGKNEVENKEGDSYKAEWETDTKNFVKAGEKKKRHPTAIILGVKKAGTRALLDILRMHPNVVGATKEIYFFNGHYHKGLEWYREQMPLSLPGQITIEKSPTYFTSTDNVATVERMYRFSKVISGEIKLLVVVRDPTERALSDYTDTKMRLKRHEGVEMEPIETCVLNKVRNAVENTSSIVKTGIYSLYLEKWAQYFTKEQLHFVSGEALVYRTFEEITLVEKFLNLTPYFTRKHFYFNKRKRFPCFIPNPDKSKKHFCLPANKGRKHTTISNITMELLRAFYRPHNEYFYQICGKNFKWS